MNEDTWTRAGEQNSATMRMNQLSYLLATAALTATIVFGASDDVRALLIVSAVGVALFGILTFDYAVGIQRRKSIRSMSKFIPRG